MIDKYSSLVIALIVMEPLWRIGSIIIPITSAFFEGFFLAKFKMLVHEKNFLYNGNFIQKSMKFKSYLQSLCPRIKPFADYIFEKCSNAVIGNVIEIENTIM